MSKNQIDDEPQSLRRSRRCAKGVAALSALLALVCACQWIRSLALSDAVQFQRNWSNGDNVFATINWGIAFSRGVVSIYKECWMPPGRGADLSATPPTIAWTFRSEYHADAAKWTFESHHERSADYELSEVGVPLYVLVAACLVVAALSYRLVRDGRSRAIRVCEFCGYDLRASPLRCPECGAETQKG